MKPQDRSKYIKEDIAAMLDSLYELLQEHGGKVTATLIAMRMEQKLHRHVHHHRAAYLYKLLGFDSRIGHGTIEKSKSFIVPDYDLLARCRAQYCKVTSDNSREPSYDRD